MKQYNLLVFIILIFFAACKEDTDIAVPSQLDEELIEALNTASNNQGIEHYKLPKSNDYSQIPQDPKNPITGDKVILGKLLYHETGLAKNPKMGVSLNSYSCSSCHFASAGFQAGRIQGIGDGGVGFGLNGEGRQPHGSYLTEDLDVQPIRTPTAMNGAYQKNMLWNGQFGATGVNENTQDKWTENTPLATNHLGFEGLETQAIAGLEVHRMIADSCFDVASIYQDLFDMAFGEIDATERYSRINAGLAVAAYERTLLANEAPFQDWLKGEYDALSESEKRGAILFFGKAECGTCHNGPALNSMEFHALGMNNLSGIGVFNTPEDADAHKGRASFTKNDADLYKFKVPQLYNLKDSPFYGHGGSFGSLYDVIQYKNQGVAENQTVPNSQLAAEFKPLGLTESEVQDIVNFIENGLHDNNLNRYVPSQLPSGYCFPNNDATSQSDLGCN